ncbi:MAG: Sec-independent protein translocase protein TatB, partial [Azospira sp.]|nr:Sec-independent protein translocase protein TatB [Azospira sp.]
MFDIAFSEMLIIAIVALVILGPERLPKVARTAGHLLGRLQRYVNDVKSDINREMHLEELKKLQAQVEDSARSLERSVTTQMQTAEASLREVAEETAAAPKEAAAAIGSAAGELRQTLAGADTGSGGNTAAPAAETVSVTPAPPDAPPPA